MEQCVTKLLREMNKLSNPPTWVGSATDIAECMRPLENYQPDSIEDLEDRAITDIGIQVLELRNILRYERGTQQKRDDSDALTSLFEYVEYELPCQYPPNSLMQISNEVCLTVLTLRMQIRRLCSKFCSNVGARKIMYYTGSQWNQPCGNLDEAPAYKPLLEYYDTIYRSCDLERAIADIYCVPNLAEYVLQRESGLGFPNSGLERIAKLGV